MRKLIVLLTVLVLLVSAAVPAAAEPQYRLVKLTDAELSSGDLSAHNPVLLCQSIVNGDNMDLYSPVFTEAQRICDGLVQGFSGVTVILVASAGKYFYLYYNNDSFFAVLSAETVCIMSSFAHYILEEIPVPETGDTTPLFALTALALTSAAALIALSRRRRFA